MTRNLKPALFSALLVLAVAYPILGLKLEISGVNLAVIGASNAMLAAIFGCAIAMFLRVHVSRPTQPASGARHPTYRVCRAKPRIS